MKRFRFSIVLSLAVAATLAGCTSTPAHKASIQQVRSLSPQSIRENLRKGVVVVRYTWQGDLGRRDVEGIGTVVREDGLTMLSIGVFPPQLPDDQIADVKIVIPAAVTGDEEKEVDAEFVSRDERTELAFVKPKEPLNLTPVKFVDRKLTVGENVYSLGLLAKSSGYHDYWMQSTVSATLRGPVPLVLVSGGLAAVGSPVVDATGTGVGYVCVQEGQTPFLAGGGREMQPLLVPPILFVPTRDFQLSLTDTPAKTRQAMPYLGVGSLTGLSKDVAEAYGIEAKPAVQVGEIVKGMAADKAGLQAADIIVAMNGQPLERGDMPEELPAILVRRIERFEPGANVVFGVVRGMGTEPIDVTVTLGERPATSGEVARSFDEALGFGVRELTFDDRYGNRLPDNFAGTPVSIIRPDSPAASAGLRPGDIVTRLNQSEVKDLEGFKTAYNEFREAKPKDAVVLEVRRGPDTQIIRIEPNE